MRGRFPAPGVLLLGWDSVLGVGMGFAARAEPTALGRVGIVGLNWIKNAQRKEELGMAVEKAPGWEEVSVLPSWGGAGSPSTAPSPCHGPATPGCPLGAEMGRTGKKKV